MTDNKKEALLSSFEANVIKDIMVFTIPAYKKLVLISHNNMEIEEDEDYDHITSLTGVSFLARKEFISSISHVQSISIALLSNQIEDTINSIISSSGWIASTEIDYQDDKTVDIDIKFSISN